MFVFQIDLYSSEKNVPHKGESGSRKSMPGTDFLARKGGKWTWWKENWMMERIG